jgi:tRNA(fMet)-specific endonuclease VapC
MNYFLNTNILLIYLRDNEQARNIEKDLKLLEKGNNLLLSVVSVGEIKSIAIQNKWGKRKIENLISILQDFLITDINTQEIIERYSEINAYSQGKLNEIPVSFSARNMGKNDLWIAATASVYDIQLITTDKDFDHLEGKYLVDLLWVDIEKYNVKK